MFITLKSSDDQTDTLKQIGARGASFAPDRDRVRPSRRLACISCKRQKLRCTGSNRDCDRCLTRSIACIFQPSQVKNSRRSARPLRQESNSGQTNESSVNPSDGTETGVPLNSQGLSVSVAENGILGGDLSSVNTHNDMAHVAMEATEQSRSGPQLDPDLFIDTIGVENGYLGDLNGLYDMDDLQNGFDLQTPQNLPDFLSLNLPETSSESPPMQGITNSPLSDTRDSNPPDSSNDGRSIESSSNTGCPCIHGAVRVVQQLDDDDFQLTKLTLDQVVQLQKWILSQCCKPLDCPNCRHLLTVHTVLVIICNRLSEMFECISIRIKRASQRLSGQSDPSSKSTASPDSDESEVYSTTTSGLPGTNAGCNPGLFSSEFQSRYSDEEQIHMIRVLLNLQLRNFRALLVRLDDQIQVASRRSKVKPVMLRLDRATTEIDIALNEVLQFFAI